MTSSFDETTRCSLHASYASYAFCARWFTRSEAEDVAKINTPWPWPWPCTEKHHHHWHIGRQYADKENESTMHRRIAWQKTWMGLGNCRAGCTRVCVLCVLCVVGLDWLSIFLQVTLLEWIPRDQYDIYTHPAPDLCEGVWCTPISWGIHMYMCMYVCMYVCLYYHGREQSRSTQATYKAGKILRKEHFKSGRTQVTVTVTVTVTKNKSTTHRTHRTHRLRSRSRNIRCHAAHWSLAPAAEQPLSQVRHWGFLWQWGT